MKVISFDCVGRKWERILCMVNGGNGKIIMSFIGMGRKWKGNKAEQC